MAINISQVSKDAEEARGIITDEVALGGDLSGTLPDATVSSLNGASLPTSGFADGFGLRLSGGNWVLETLLTEDSSFNGDVSGTQSGGLSVGGIDGNPVEITSPSENEVLKFNSSGILVNALDSGGMEVIVADNADVTATNKSIVFVNTVTNAVTVTAPSSPSVGDFFYIKDSHGAFLSNNCSLSGTVEGDPTGAILASNNMLIMFQYNGIDWRYSVLWGGH